MERKRIPLKYRLASAIFGAVGLASFVFAGSEFIQQGFREEQYIRHPMHLRAQLMFRDAADLNTIKPFLVEIPPHWSTLPGNYFPEPLNMPEIPPSPLAHVPVADLAVDELKKIDEQLKSEHVMAVSQELEQTISNIGFASKVQPINYDAEIIEIERLRQELIRHGLIEENVAREETIESFEQQIAVDSRYLALSSLLASLGLFSIGYAHRKIIREKAVLETAETARTPIADYMKDAAEDDPHWYENL